MIFQGFLDITGHTGTRLKTRFFELLSGRSGVRITSGTPKGLAWAGPFLIYAFKNGDDPAGMLVSVLADFIDKTVITLTYCFFSTSIYSREILSTGEYVYILKGLAQFA